MSPNLWREVDVELSLNLAYQIVSDFLDNSWQCVESIVERSSMRKKQGEGVDLYRFKNGKRDDVTLSSDHLFIRASVEYSNPQLTVEEVQGIIAARLLEVCGNYFQKQGLGEIDRKDVEEICEMLAHPCRGTIIPFLLNTDEIEPDRYSMNPLKESIVNSGQSAFPSAYVRTGKLEIDKNFIRKYEGSLISKEEIELIKYNLETCGNSYLDMVDAVKYQQLEDLSETFGINLSLNSMRLPLARLEKESTYGMLHHTISKIHRDYESIAHFYSYMGRSMKKLTTLPTIPHSQKGYGSKRAARGKVHFFNTELKNIKVKYKRTPLYPNAIDPEDVSIAEADDSFTVAGSELANYDYQKTPSSPQFALFSLASPEDSAVWHGIGAFGASKLLKSYVTMRLAYSRNISTESLSKKFGVSIEVPLQFNLLPHYMWFHPTHRNIDASIGCIDNLKDLADIGMKMELLHTDQYIRPEI